MPDENGPVSPDDVDELRGAVIHLADRVTTLSESLSTLNELQQRQQEQERKQAETTAAAMEAQKKAEIAATELTNVKTEVEQTVKNVVPRDEHERRWRRENIIFTMIGLVGIIAIVGVIYNAHNASVSRNQRRDTLQTAIVTCVHNDQFYDEQRQFLRGLLASNPVPGLRENVQSYLNVFPSDTNCAPYYKNLQILGGTLPTGVPSVPPSPQR